jgi:hypothetical protein
VQELLGYRDVKTTIVYTHVLNRGGRGVASPADDLPAAGCVSPLAGAGYHTAQGREVSTAKPLTPEKNVAYAPRGWKER